MNPNPELTVVNLHAAQHEFPAAPAEGAIPTETTHVWRIRNLNKSYLEDYTRFSSDDDFTHRQYIRQQSRDAIAYLDSCLASYLVNPHVIAAHHLPTAFPPIVPLVEPLNPPMIPLEMAQIRGQPGDGKSTEGWGWFQLQKLNRAWVHCFRRDSKDCLSVVTITWDHSIDSWICRRGAWCSIQQVLHILNDVQMVVLDGEFPGSEYEKMMSQALKENKFFVSITTGYPPWVGNALLLHFRCRPFMFSGFCLEDYLQADSLAPNPRHRKTADQIKERFYYAGGSARYYWRFSDVSQLIQ
jgi:hypothetical protein